MPERASLGELVRDRMAAFPASGEINSKLAQPAEAIARVEQHFAIHALEIHRPTVSAWRSRSGASTCARPIPSRWCA
ncbi:hypothetical protein ACVXG7_21715 [Enterobacter hormaechei]